MFFTNRFHKDEKGQTALETAIILIAFVVVASVFAFTILSAGTASTEKGEEAIYSGLEGVQSSMTTKGAVIAEGDTTNDVVTSVIFNLALANGASPIDLDAAGSVVISYRDASQLVPELTWTVDFIGTDDGDTLLEESELAEITVDLTGTSLGANTAFTLEVKPPTGAVISMSRNTPAAIDAVMELR